MYDFWMTWIFLAQFNNSTLNRWKIWILSMLSIIVILSKFSFTCFEHMHTHTMIIFLSVFNSIYQLKKIYFSVHSCVFNSVYIRWQFSFCWGRYRNNFFAKDLWMVKSFCTCTSENAIILPLTLSDNLSGYKSLVASHFP